MTSLINRLSRLSSGAKLAIVLVLAACTLGSGLYACGAINQKAKTAVVQQKAETKGIVVAGVSQRDLDRTTAAIGADVQTREVVTVRRVERTKTEIRDVVAKEPDPLVRLSAWRDRIVGLRHDLCLDRAPGADGRDACDASGALHGRGPAER